MKIKIFFAFFIFFNLLFSQTIKDISNIVGIRENNLIGYGLVVGLPGTGDKSKFTMQSLQNLLRNSYIKIPTSSIKSKNIATVMVTAILPPFARQGDKIRVNVASIGDAKSLDGGELLLTQLKGVDGKVYALAQGKIVANPNNKTTGFIYDGAIIENEVEFPLYKENELTISLLRQDAKTAALVEKAINKRFNQKLAFAIDTRTIKVIKPKDLSMVEFIALIQDIQINSSMRQKIIIDARRGMVIAGGDIPIKPITISQNDFTIKIKKPVSDFDDKKKYPGLDIGDDVKIGNKPIKINLYNAIINTKKQPTISDLVRSMKVMKLDINKIIQTINLLKKLNAIEAQVEIIR